eukprot:GHUV01035581.1.p2 GENE.GHUV01035581.1~~GHUV01035581.1.p2  ORF type:complete len:123 (+),score=19.85 GHUV01035581.1:138-506(+)
MGSQFVLHDDEIAPSTIASVFEVEQPSSRAKQSNYLQRVQRPAADALSGDDKEIASFEGFTSPWYKQLLFIVLGICTFGVLFLVAKWSMKARTALRFSKCPLQQAKFVRVTVSGVRGTAATR